MKKSNPIDLVKFKNIAGDDLETIIECFNDFLLIIPVKLEDLKKKIKTKKNDQLINSTHSLKNVLRYISAENAAHIVHKIEELSEKKEYKEIKGLYGDLEKEIVKVKQFILEFISLHSKE